jgi:hypothetical protein
MLMGGLRGVWVMSVRWGDERNVLVCLWEMNRSSDIF